jgi:hypothetical protein
MNTCSSITSQSGIQSLTPTVVTSPHPFNLVDKVKAFFRGLLFCGNPLTSRSVPDRFDSAPASLASVTTPHGLWVYTVVPWED